MTYPEGFLEIISSTGEEVTFELNPEVFGQTPTTIAVRVFGDDTYECAEVDVSGSVAQSTDCENGFTDLALFVHFGNDSTSFEKCKACEAPDDSVTDLVAYYFEVNCAAEAECEPTASPTSGPKHRPRHIHTCHHRTHAQQW